MKFHSHNELPIDTNMTSYRGEIDISYYELCELFGPPLKEGFDDYKSDAEWHVQFENGAVATIYNWKNGRNYCGSDGLNVEAITEWHVGGHSADVMQLVRQVVREDVTGSATVLPLP